jgi:uncharacterized repeat protein (TIGR03803 family)
MPCSGLLWLGCALAAMGMAQAAPQPSVETVLHAFANAAPNGGTPGAGLIEDQAGNLYGTTSTGGSAGAGEVFKVYPGGHLSVLYSFTGGADGGNPYSPLIRDPAGNLYGTASAGGTAKAGVVFKIDTSGNETVLYSFTGGADGGYPFSAGLILDSAGNLYGTAGGGSGFGVVFKLDPTEHETVLFGPKSGAPGSGSPFVSPAPAFG